MVLGAVVTGLLLVHPRIGGAQSGPPANAPPSENTQATAKKLATEAIEAYNAEDYERSIALNLRAFVLVPHPGLLFNIAQAHRLAKCPERAVPFYERYLALEPDGKESAASQAALDEIKHTTQTDGPHCSKTLTIDDVTRALPAANPAGRLKLSSLPNGAVVMIDGVKIGVTPLEHEFAAGEHTIVLVDGGTRVGERKIKILSDATIEVTMPVVYPTDDPRYVPPPEPSRAVPISLFAGAGILLVGSGLMLYLGEQGGEAHPEDKYRYRGATPAGFALAGAGAVAIGVGIWFWVRGSRESAPVVAIGAGEGYLGWSGRF
ncbi:MAG TPA: PEGA domain-containing protein [Kofleriaceae bacterium]|nr:PEGA domain-containing protein [Kofleriaceae bacterium]